MNAISRTNCPSSQTGSTLLEVLIAVLVLSTGMLGVAAMQSTSLRNSQSALQRSQAVTETYAIIDAMRANAGVARTGGYDLVLGATSCPVPAAGSTLATVDLSAWITSLQTTLGSTACGGIACVTGLCTITVLWDDSLGSGGSATEQLQTVSRI